MTKIDEMNRQQCHALLRRETLGRLGCAQDGQPYVVPVSYVFEEGIIYSFATFGQKVEWMRHNPLVCLEVDKIRTRLEWECVVVFGRFEEIPADDAHENERQVAWDILQHRANWWEPAFTRTVTGGLERELSPLYFLIRVESVTGRRMTPPGHAGL
ncbi:pyridoxamine 5'-phosphate oxidase family protein [Pararhizobium haloflavum]|uniref:pyridoxamine 5'-phosphate oxidase family protein n=1 Tax=Pararhizobium haloflavum TaxID=2037914 RepID=UPI000C18BB83|nr:pyridoxamine 5'-phosphate oxidase family protein [Pararhizobium haloflavum]